MSSDAEFRGLSKVVDGPRANRSLNRGYASRDTSPMRESGVFGGAASFGVIHATGRRHPDSFSRQNSKTSVFGSEASSQQVSRPSARRSSASSVITSPLGAVPGVDSRPVSAGGAPGSVRPAVGRKAFMAKDDSVLSPENFRPLRRGEKAPVFCVGDSQSHRPHSAGHGRAHIHHRNKDSVMFGESKAVNTVTVTPPSPTVAAPTPCGTTDQRAATPVASEPSAVMDRYDKRFVRQTSGMQRFTCRPDAVKRTALTEQVPQHIGKKVQEKVQRQPSLAGVLAPEPRPSTIDRSYRPVAPWK